MTTEIGVKQVEPLHVLTARKRLVDQDDVVRTLVDLLPSVADVIAGPPMALRLGFSRDGRTDFDITFPLDQPLTRGGFVTKTLPSLPMFSITHKGPLTSGPEGSNLADTWKDFVEFVQGGSILAGDDPQRFTYHVTLLAGRAPRRPLRPVCVQGRSGA